MNQKINNVFTLLVISLIAALFFNLNWFLKTIYPLKYEDYIVKYSKEYGLDPYLIASVIKIESNFNPSSISNKGAVGLMQIMPSTAVWAAEKMGIKEEKIDLMDPKTNIMIGTWYLSDLLREFQGDITLALAAYNGGRGNVREWVDRGLFDVKNKKEEEIPFEETKFFVMKVKKAYYWYKKLYRLK
ncbi:lytic transglycosylase domain-containing protein [Thermovenabulum sp.]|uniref:lytic transglycosylase domain-containing protein n=1 Tax=Thermovenabulum sp. TaxID=3100335 RepID=UPI003C7D0938